MGVSAALNRKRVSDFYKDPEFREYMREINSLPRLSSEEQNAMLIRASKGDTSVIDSLVLSNLRLVVSIAASYAILTTHFKMLDIVQEGSLSLIKAIETYKPELGFAFSTYATKVIENGIKAALAQYEYDIRISSKMISDARNYNKLIATCEQNGVPIPSDEDAARMLGITVRALVEARASELLKPVSMNKAIDDEDGKSELGDFIPSYESGYEEILGKRDDFDTLVALKEILTPEEYFIIYYRFIAGHPATQRDIAKLFRVTHQRVQQKEAKALAKIKSLSNGRNLNLSRIIDRIQRREKGFYESINTEPISPDKIVTYLFVKDQFSDFEREILVNVLFPFYNLPDSAICVRYGLSSKEYHDIVESLYERVSILLKDNDKYERFKKNLLVTYGFKIYKIKSSTRIIDYDKLHSDYSSLSYGEIMNLFNDYSLLPDKTQKLLQRYFDIPRIKTDKTFLINGEVNAVVNGYKERKTSLDNKILYACYKENRLEFSLVEQLYLECFVFNKKDPDLFTNIYGPYKKTKVHRKKFRLIAKLERLHYQIDSIFDGMITKEVYAGIVERNEGKIPGELRELLDEYYGYKTEKKSSGEIAEKWGIESEKMRNIIFEAKDKLLVIETNRSQAIKVSRAIYEPYIENRIYEYPDNMREALRLFIMSGKTHAEIAEKLNVTPKEVAVMLSKGVQKMDFYRFNVIDPIKVDFMKLQAFLQDSENTLSDDHKKIALLKYAEYKENSEIAEILHTKLAEINRMSADINAAYLKWLCKDIEITIQDVRMELFAHPVESVLTDEEKLIICLYTGIKYKINREGKSFTPKEIGQICGITGDVTRKIIAIINKLKAKKIGYIKPDLIFTLSRAEVANLLFDPRLPVSEADKELVSRIMALDGGVITSFKEIATSTGENEKTLRRRYQMAMVNMNKYKKGEIEGIISYEFDVLSNFKYFSKSDRILLEEYYKNGLSIEAIAKKYNLSKQVSKATMARIVNYLHLLLHFESTPKIDFDYIESVSSKEDLPFNGDGKQMYQVFALYFGQDSFERHTLKDIKKILNISVKEETLKRMLQNFILACLKYQDKIRREKTFSYDEIKSYYDTNSSSLNERQKRSFANYFDRYDDSGVVGQKVSTTVRNLMLTTSIDNPFNVSTATREDVIAILKKYYYGLSKATKETLMARFGISEREFMSGKEINQVFRTLDESLRVEKELETPSSLVRTQ